MARADQGPCCLGDVIEGTENGSVVSVGDMPAYFTPSAAGSAAVVVVNDIFGFELPNSRRVVDFLAAAGFSAILPETFDNNPWREDADWAQFGPWRESYPPAACLPRAHACREWLLQRPGVESVHIVGFCWGGRVVHHALLASPPGTWRSGVAFYGAAGEETPNRGAVRAPVSFVFAETDHLFPPEWLAALRAELETADVETSVEVYEGQTHGFAHRKNAKVEGDADDQARTRAMQGMLAWLRGHA